MLDGIKRFLSRKSSPPASDGDSEISRALLQRLQSYPAIQLPHTGEAIELKPDAVDENFTYWQRILPERLILIRGLLSEYGINWPQELDTCEYNELLTQTREWARKHWPVLATLVKSDAITRWQEQQKSADCIVFTLVSDVSLLLGELIIAKRPSFKWGIDTDEKNRDDAMGSVNNLVLLSHWASNPNTQVEIFIEGTVVVSVLHPNDSSERLLNNWLYLVDNAISGGYEGNSSKESQV